MRRLLGAGRAARGRRHRRDRVDRDQLLPHPGGQPRRAGGGDRRRPGYSRRPAPGAARDGGTRRVAVRLLHAGVRVQHGRRVLPLRAEGHQRLRPRAARRVPRRQRLRPPRAQRQPLPLHRVPPDQGRRLRPGLPCRRRHARLPPYGDPAGRRTDQAPRRRGPLHQTDRPPAGTGDPGRGARLHRRRRQHRLGRRRQPQGSSEFARTRRRPARRAAWLDRRRRRGAHRCGPDAERDRAAPRAVRGQAAAAGRAVPAVRLPAHPQRRHPRRQPRHRFADRRRATGPARPGGERGSRFRRRDADGAAERVLHRVPRVGPRRRRADHRGRHPVAGRGHHGVPQDRQAPLRRHQQRGRRVRAGHRRRHGGQGPDRARRGRRDPDPRHGHGTGARRQALERRDGPGRGRRAGRRGHADLRPAGQRRVPIRHARQRAAEGCWRPS